MIDNFNHAELKFTAHNIYFNFFQRLKGYVSGIFNRTNTLKTFCLDHAIEYPPNLEKKHHFPKGWIVKLPEIGNYGKIRDAIILGYHEKYANKQKEVVKHMYLYEDEVKLQQKFLNDELRELEKLKTKRKATADPSDKIFFDDRIGSQKTKIKNLESDISEIKNKYNTLENILKDNHKSWDAQVDIIEACIDTEINRFINSATKKVSKVLNYTKFNYVTPPHSDNVKKIVKGVYND